MSSKREINYHDRWFRSAANTPNGEVGAGTIFHYRQEGNIVWATYEGGEIVKGSLIATAAAGGALDMRYHHVNRAGEIMTGECRSTPEILPDGRLRLHESWRWTSGDRSSGTSIVEEIADS